MIMPSQLGGVTGADAECAARAAAAGVDGTFVAWLSSSANDAQTRLGSARGWTRRDGLVVADRVTDLATGLVHPIALDENGNDLGAGAYATGEDVLTATRNGMLDGPSCGDFTSASGNVTFGALSLAHAEWSSRTPEPCTTPAHLYCFQIDLQVTVTPATTTGRLAFVSAGNFTPSSGIAAADALCASEADAVGRTGTFLAMLPVGGVASAARFDGSLGPWVRSDGIALAATGDEVINSQANAPLDHTAAGAVVDADPITGCDSPAFFTAGEDCSDWSSTVYGNSWGNTSSAGGVMFNQTTSDCTTPLPVYCFQQ